MARDDRSFAPLYLALGALAAVGAGYLVWRYALSDDQKEKTREVVLTGIQKARSSLRDNTEMAREAAREAFENTPVTR